MKTVVFDNSNEAKLVVLALLGYSVDAEGFVIDNSRGDRAVTPNNEELTLSNFTGVRPGSEVFFTNDLPSLLEQAEYIRA